MQGFRTSAPTQAAHDTSTIDFFTFPEIPPEPPLNPYARMRVPLLPDNYTPDRSVNSAHAAESFDAPVAKPEIHIVAGHPERVAPVAMSEVSHDGMETSLGELTKGFTEAVETVVKEPGIVRELFSGMVDDIFGSKKAAH